MRIVHTADWHLCDRLGRIDRTDDLKRRVEAVAEICNCDERRVDALLIAGDLFSEQASADDMTAALLHLRECFLPFFRRNGTILAVTGNHDRNRHIDMVRAGMGLAVPAAGSHLVGGRMYLANNPTLVRLGDPTGGVVQFVLLPYPFPSRYRVTADAFQSKEDENAQVRARVTDWLQRKTADAAFDQTLPTVLVAHLHVRGSEMTTAYKMTDRDDILFDVRELHPDWRYVALGHIHKPQCLGGGETVRYPGSLDRLDFGDTHDTHGVVLLDVNGADAVTTVRLPIAPTPFHTITIADPDTELPTLHEKYPDHNAAVVRVVVHPPAVMPRDEVQRQLKRMFPRWHAITWAAPEGGEAGTPAAFTPRAGFEETVRAYLTEQLDREADADKAHVLALADTFLTPGGAS